MKAKSLAIFGRNLSGTLLGGACFVLLIGHGQAKAACIDTFSSAASNCELFDAPSGNSFAYDVYSGALGAASSTGGSFQIGVDGLNSGQVFGFANLQLVLTGTPGTATTTINVLDNSFTANNTDLPSFFTSRQTFSSLGIGSITGAVLSGTFSVASPVAGLTPTTFFGGVRFNTSGTVDGNGLLAVGTSGGLYKGENILGSAYAENSVPGPLPALGAGMAFGFSRRLRKRIYGS